LLNLCRSIHGRTRRQASRWAPQRMKGTSGSATSARICPTGSSASRWLRQLRVLLDQAQRLLSHGLADCRITAQPSDDLRLGQWPAEEEFESISRLLFHSPCRGQGSCVPHPNRPVGACGQAHSIGTEDHGADQTLVSEGAEFLTAGYVPHLHF